MKRRAVGTRQPCHRARVGSAAADPRVVSSLAIRAYAGLVILSTLLCKQHHLIDVISGAALSLAALGAVAWLERNITAAKALR